MARRPSWLTAEQQSTWRSFLLTTQLVGEQLERQMQRDADMPHVYYGILVALSESPDGATRMTDLATMLRYSPSRMSHAVDSLVTKGWVRREPCPGDRRGQMAVLTDAGHDALEAAAPAHVAEVRRLVFERLTAEQAAQLREICDALLEGLDASSTWPVGPLDPVHSER